MALTFTDWTHYTDDAGNSQTLNWTDPKQCTTRAHGEAVRQALMERCTVTSVTPGAILTTPIVQHHPALYAWGNAFQTVMDLLVPNFMDWTLLADGGTELPLWTEAALLASAGMASRSPMVRHAPLLGFWVKQQYEFLRRFLWQNKAMTFYCEGQRKDANGATFADAMNAALASWAVGSWPRWSAHQILNGETYIQITSNPTDWRVTWHRVRGWVDTYEISTAFYHEAAAYFFFTFSPKTGAPNWYPGYAIWDDEGQGYPDQRLQLIETFARAKVASRTGAIVVGSIDSLPPQLPTPPGNAKGAIRGWEVRGYDARHRSSLVLKWNVPGGFVFQGS